jgi:hypothetical protein
MVAIRAGAREVRLSGAVEAQSGLALRMHKMAIELTGQWSSGRSKGRVLLRCPRRCSRCRLKFSLPAPAEQTSKCRNQAGQSGADNGAGDGGWYEATGDCDDGDVWRNTIVEVGHKRGPMSLRLHWLAGRRIGDYPFVRCLGLNSTNGVLQHRTLTIVVCFVERTLAKLALLHVACAIVEGAPVFKSIYL